MYLTKECIYWEGGFLQSAPDGTRLIDLDEMDIGIQRRIYYDCLSIQPASDPYHSPLQILALEIFDFIVFGGIRTKDFIEKLFKKTKSIRASLRKGRAGRYARMRLLHRIAVPEIEIDKDIYFGLYIYYTYTRQKGY